MLQNVMSRLAGDGLADEVIDVILGDRATRDRMQFARRERREAVMSEIVGEMFDIVNGNHATALSGSTGVHPVFMAAT